MSKTLEELKQEMDSALAAYATADDAEDSTWSAWDDADDVYNAMDIQLIAGWAAWDDAARDATYARDAYIVAQDAYNKKLKEDADEDT